MTDATQRRNKDPNLALPERQLFDSISRTPFVDSAELALVLGEPHATVHHALTGLLADGIVGRLSHGTAQLPWSQRYYLTTEGIRETAGLLGLRDTLRLRASLPCVQGVAGAAHPPDGRRGRRLPTRRVALPRHRRPPFARGVPPQGPLRRHHHPP